ncbi:ABC transporter substrate-binding protein [Oceanobacter sp. 3_MG-2023]|uniref:ABC transporter substrate-binding protein n=1 Tax=Oceanobacter sp. 3_MG-2023 TaxID=3062622 RepID=UPI002734DD7D|nr:hypothetical protein [Oceanobacter sp. 3_MG-2023]MDP2507138.1 hypothetical protein [Oceanobacter sp. 3_MG-2023]
MPLSSFAAQIAVIESYHPEYEWDAQYLKAIDDSLGKIHQIQTYSLDTKRLTRDNWPIRAQQILERVKAQKPAVALIGDDNALELMGESLQALGIPIVFLGINGGPEQHPVLLKKGVTGVQERPFFDQSIRHIRKMVSNPDRFLILADDSPTMRSTIQERFGDQRKETIHGSEVDILLTNDRDTWLNAITNGKSNGYAAVIVGTYHTIRDGQGVRADPTDLMQMAHSSSSLPIFALWDVFIGKGKAAGGFTVSAYNEGRHAARLVKLLLNGTAIDKLPHTQSQKGEHVYSESGLQHWNLHLSTLDASQTRFKD